MLRVLAIILLGISAVFADDKIKIGVSAPLTGDAATYGVDLKNILTFANEKIAQSKYDLVFEDDRCNGRDAVAVAHRFLSILNIKYVAGYICSSTVFSTAPLYEKAHVPALVLGSAPKISELGDYIFRTEPSDADAAQKLYDYISPRHKRFGLLNEQTDYAQGIEQAFLQSNHSNKLVVMSESYTSDTTDYRPLLLKFRSSEIDGLMINSQTEATFLAALKQFRELKMNVPVYGAYWPGSKAFLEKAGELANGIIYADLPSLDSLGGHEATELRKEYNDRYGQINSIEIFLFTAFESFRALHQAIESGQDASKFLYDTKFHGLFGDWSFDKNGDIVGLKFVLKVIKDGKPVELVPSSYPS